MFFGGKGINKMVKCQILAQKRGGNPRKTRFFVEVASLYVVIKLCRSALLGSTGNGLIVFWLDLEISLWVVAHWADFWSLLAYADVAAVGALPDAVAVA